MTDKVFFIVLDTFRKDMADLDERKIAPNLAEFSDESTNYENAYSQGSWSVPSHSSMFTGKYPSEHGATLYSPFLKSQETLASRFRENGYRTVGISPNYYVDGFTGLDRGFDHFRKIPDSLLTRRMQRIAGRIATFIGRRTFITKRMEKFYNWWETRSGESEKEEHKGHEETVLEEFSRQVDREDEEFFFINFFGTHLPRDPKEKHFEDLVEDPELKVPKYERQVNFGKMEMTERKTRKMEQLYKADMKTDDEAFGRLMDELKERDDYEDSLVIVVSDHGENLGEDDMIGHLYSLRDNIIHVPLFIKFPGQKEKEVVENIVEIRNLFHTALDEAGIENLSRESLRPPVEQSGAYGEFFSAGWDSESVQNGNPEFSKNHAGKAISYEKEDEQSN